jgi:gluconolactonase
MYEAFELAGYDVKLVIGEEGHNMKQCAAIMPEALRWLWREYPAPVTVHEPAAMSQPGWDPRGKAYSAVWAAKPWQQVGGTYASLSNAASDKEGNVYFAESPSGRIYQSDADGKVKVWKEKSGATALAAGPDGRLYASVANRIVSYGPSGDEKTVAQNVDAGSLAITAGAALYFIDRAHKSVGYAGPDGKTRTVYDGGGMAAPSSLALSPDQAMLIVTDAQARYSWSFQIGPDGSLVNGEPFYRLEIPESGWMSSVHGVAEDSIGQVYFASPLGIQMCEANGRVAMILNPPETGAVSSLLFGGRDLNWLYVTEGSHLFRRPVKVTGTASWAPVKPPKPPL